MHELLSSVRTSEPGVEPFQRTSCLVFWIIIFQSKLIILALLLPLATFARTSPFLPSACSMDLETHSHLYSSNTSLDQTYLRASFSKIFFALLSLRIIFVILSYQDPSEDSEQTNVINVKSSAFH